MIIPPLRKSILVHATAKHVFATFTQGGWWPKQHSILASGTPQKAVIVEPRVGGRWYEVGDDGSECVWGRVLAIEPPRRLLLTWQINGDFELDPSAASEVEVLFVPEAEGTRVTLEHRNFEAFATTGQKLRDAVDQDGGWSGLLQLLAQASEAKQPSPTRYFFCKLIPPRPTFMEDMNDAEGEALGAHVAYWTGRIAQKKAIVFGPVGDPTGVWGMGILAVSDEDEARQIAMEDPAITSGLGFQFEMLPMLQSVVA